MRVFPRTPCDVEREFRLPSLGRRTYANSDESRDNLVFGILAFGEGWHNTHHTFPTSARHGLQWWQLDLSYMLIRVLAWMRLAWNIKLPTREAQVAPLPRSSPAKNAQPDNVINPHSQL